MFHKPTNIEKQTLQYFTGPMVPQLTFGRILLKEC